MRCAFSAKPAILAKLNTLRFLLFIFGAVVVDPITNCALEMDDFAHTRSSLQLKVKAPDRNRTGGLVLTKDVLYRLSYRGIKYKKGVYVCTVCLSSFILQQKVI